MKGLFLASLLFAGSIALKDSEKREVLDRESPLFKSRAVSKARGDQLKSRRRKRKANNVKDAEVSGYHVEFFQAFFLETDTYSVNATQFGSWYEDDVNNATRVEVVTYYGDEIIPGEYITLGDVEYGIYEDDDDNVVCEIGTPSSGDALDYEYIGYAFIAFSEDAYPIIWGPRLVEAYYDPNTDEDTKSYVGIDAFTGEPVLYNNFNDTFENVFVWSRIHKEDVDATDFVVPDGIDCTSVDNADEDLVAWHDRWVVDIARKFRMSTFDQLF